MSLATQVTTRTKSLDSAERVAKCCQTAKTLERTGRYEAAYEALKEFWPDLKKKPDVAGLELSIRAELLLRAGSVSGWLGSANQTNGGQEGAKDLITESLELFHQTAPDRVPEAQADLALCYWREGAFDEARINLLEELKQISSDNYELRACLLIRA